MTHETNDMKPVPHGWTGKRIAGWSTASVLALLVVLVAVLMELDGDASTQAGENVVWLVTTLTWLAVLAALYLLPTGIAMVRKMPNAAPIAFINLLLGWTGVGWVIALVMASMQVQQARPALVIYRPGDVVNGWLLANDGRWVRPEAASQ